jgi:hypothetical protein
MSRGAVTGHVTTQRLHPVQIHSMKGTNTHKGTYECVHRHAYIHTHTYTHNERAHTHLASTLSRTQSLSLSPTHTHTHTYIYIYIHKYTPHRHTATPHHHTTTESHGKQTFRSSPAGGTDVLSHVAGGHRSTESKVSDLRSPVVGDENISGLEIPMDDRWFLIMQIDQRSAGAQ